MNDRLKMPTRATSKATRNATGSRASASGPTPCVVPDGLIVVPSGLAVALASLSPRQARVLALKTSGTYGLPGYITSSSDALQRSLANRLQAAMAGRGSMLFKLTWKQQATPARRLIWQLQASARRTSDSDCSSWATSNASAPGGTPEQALLRKLGLPCGQSVTTLDHQAQLAAWPTAARDWKGATDERWGTNSRPLNEVAALAHWPTATARDGRGYSVKATQEWVSGLTSNGHHLDLDLAAKLATSGLPVIGSPAETEKRGQLNPAHSRWLMGLPPVWDVCAVMAMQSLPLSRKNSSGST